MDGYAHRVEQAIQACRGHAFNFLVVISYYLFQTRPGRRPSCSKIDARLEPLNQYHLREILVTSMFLPALFKVIVFST